MGGASKLLSSLLLTSSPLRLRPSAAAAALFLSPPAATSRRLLLLSSPSPFRTLSTSSSAASLPHGSITGSPAPPPRDPFPEWSRFVDRLAAAGYASRAPCPADELALASGCGLSDGAEAAVLSCLAFARDRPDLLRSLPRKDVEVLVANAVPALFKDGDLSVQRLRRYLAGEESDDIVSERAETVDIVQYMLSYTYSSSDSYSEDKELTDSAVRNILAELVSFSGLSQSSSFVESTLRQTSSSQHERFSRPPGKNIEMKRGDWICTRCSFMNFARNVRCLECNEHRPKKMLTGGEWECPQCEFYNYGRNMECLRCTCKRPATIPPNPASAGAGLCGVPRLLNVTDVGKSEIERKLAENDEKAERWLSKVSQLDDSADLSSLAEDEDFPEIMPMRKGVNKFVVSTRKTPLERRLANAQYNINNSPGTASSDSKISQTLDRILGRSTSTAAPNNQSGTEGANTEAPKKLVDRLGGINPVPFVPLSADLFARPQSSNGQTNEDGQIQTEANSTVPPPERRDGKELLDTADKWSNKVAKPDNVKDLPGAISDENFPEIMPMRKGENQFVISKKKDRSLTSPQYKRRSVLEQVDDSNFVPFVPFPPGYFTKKDKPMESTPDAVIMSEGSPGAEKHPETNASLGNSAVTSTSQVVGSQPKGNMNNENWNRSYSKQNSSAGGYTYDDRNDYQHQPQSHELRSRSSGASNTGTWNTDYSQGTFNESTGESTYNVTNCSAQPPYTSGYSNSNNSWSSGNKNSNNAWSVNSNYNNNTDNNSSTWKGNSSYDGNTWSSNSSYNNNAWSSNSNNNQSGTFVDNSSAASSSSYVNYNQTVHNSSYGGSSSRGYTGKSLEGSAVKDPDPLDMSEEAKAERWFRRAAQIKDISELANIPDEDFPEIMPMRKGVNRFVVSKRKTPLERRLTSPQYRRNLPIVSSEPEKKDGS
ncbi:zinc finger protein VAR3, chloroplastic-like [Phragmites australis]|uniref:zinc finger protein VAR3, chloroplastic-like n=1 Tax=Phragmites australis TaxID=29695 RepID=UPI002D791A50|nr:zinc finger protein VAR3, chloroplastic-like [Phragmites australis]